jgi:hypothetical protein
VKAIGLTLVLSVVATVIIAYAIKAVLGLRPTVDAEREGCSTRPGSGSPTRLRLARQWRRSTRSFTSTR